MQKAVTGWDQLRRGSPLSQLLQLIEMTRQASMLATKMALPFPLSPHVPT